MLVCKSFGAASVPGRKALGGDDAHEAHQAYGLYSVTIRFLDRDYRYVMGNGL